MKYRREQWFYTVLRICAAAIVLRDYCWVPERIGCNDKGVGPSARCGTGFPPRPSRLAGILAASALLGMRVAR